MIDKNDSRLTDFVLGELNETDTSEIQDAIAKSPELAAAVDEIRQMVGLLGAAYQAEEPLRLLDDQKAALAQAGVGAPDIASVVSGNSSQSELKPASELKSGRSWLPIVLAASLLGVLVGGAVYLSDPPLANNVAMKMDKMEGMERSDIKKLKRQSQNQDETVDAIAADEKDLAELGSQPLMAADIDSQAGDWQQAQQSQGQGPGQGPREGKQQGQQGEGQQGQGQRGRGAIQQGRQGEGQKEDQATDGLVDDSMTQQSGRGRANRQPSMRNSFSFDSPSRKAEPAPPSRRHAMGGRLPETKPERVGGKDVASAAVAPIALAPAKPTRGGEKFSKSRSKTMNETATDGRMNGQPGAVEESLDEGKSDSEALDDSSAEWESKSIRRRNYSEIELSEDSKPATPSYAPNRRLGHIQGDFAIGSPVDDEDESGFGGRGASGFGSGRATTETEAVQGGGLGGGMGGGMGGGRGGGFGMGGGGMGSPTDKDSGGSFGIPSLSTKKTPAEQKLFDESKQLRELGIDLYTKMDSQTKTRTVPVQRFRTEKRIRKITKDDGAVVEQEYEVTVPYTEIVTQSLTVNVPLRYLRLEEEKSEKLVSGLAKKIDPDGKREFRLEELIESENLESGLGKNAFDDEETVKLFMALKLVTEKGGLKGKTEAGIDTSDMLTDLGKALKKRNAEVRRTQTWKRVKAIPNTTRLMIGDSDELDLTGMQVNVQVDGFRARVLIDCFYYNDRAEQLEGNFKLRLPDDSSLYYFAFGESAYGFDPKGPLVKEEFLNNDETQFVSLGAPDIRKARERVWAKVKEARMVPKEKAAHAFRETVRRKIDPALVEWSGAGVFNARVFPLGPHKLHRIVIGYDVNLTKTKNGWEYQLDMPEQVGQCQVDLNVQQVEGIEYQMVPKSAPYSGEVNGKPARRYTFRGPQKNGIKLIANLESANKEVAIVSNSKTEGEFFGVQVTPELPVEKVAGNAKAIFMLDTSLSSNPDKFNVWLKMLETTLNNNRDSLKQFNVLFFNVGGHFWQDKYVDNTPENVAELMKACDTLALEGATDLYGAVAKIAKADWVYGDTKKSAAQQSTKGSAGASMVKPATGPDLFLLSDGAANWGETNLRLIGRQLADHQLGSLFAYQTGRTGTSISSLRFLAGETGGAVFSVATEDEIKIASTAHRKRPWKLESVTADGATDLMTAGRVQWVYPGQTITVVGRGKIAGELKLNLTQAGESKTVSVSTLAIESELASRLYGQVAVGQLESLGAKVFDVATAYARHFRITGDTCSLLMLESEADYQRFNIKPQEDLFVIKAKHANVHVTDVLKESADKLSDPKAQLEAWLERLETMPGMEFKMPTALRLVMEKINVVAVSKPLDCSQTKRGELSDEYLKILSNEKLDYDLIETEANRRAATSVDDAIKVFSSLVERNPGDIVIARDVAFTAMELGRPAQAYHLLRQVAEARPFEGSIYPALGQCLTQLGEADMALIYYEIALGGSFQRQGSEFKQIVSAEYMHLLGKIKSGEMKSTAKEFASARLDSLKKTLKFDSADLVITMLWNTDQTDVDLHVTEPNGEECSYENKKTRSGGKITSDITTGFGPEMYTNPNAPSGKYDIKVKYYSNSQSRTELRNKVHLLIYRGLGTDGQRLTRRTVRLKKVGDKESVATIGVD
ncbi:MAG: hypothetical protein AB8B55_10725 [Mariniblastus sp.]